MKTDKFSDRVKKQIQPVIKNWPIKLGITLMLVAVIFAALIFFGTWGEADLSDEYNNGGSILIPTPSPASEPTPEATPEQTPDTTPDPDDATAPDDMPDETPEPLYDTDNPLTGLPMEESKTLQRPLAIVLSNYPAATLPMNGVSSADIIYEYPVEGGLTRMLALFQDFSSIPKVGSIRSARHYSVEIAESYDAIFVHAGGSPLAYSEIGERRITNFDEVQGTRREIFFRDRNRIDGRRVDHLHSLVTTGQRLIRWFPEYNFRKDHADNYKHGITFTDIGTPVDGDSAENITIRFSAAKTTSVIYNPSQNVYNLRQYGRDFIDANNNSKPGFTNVLILRTRVSDIPDDEAGRQDVVTTGRGSGFFICGGSYIEINWSRANKSSPFTYSHKDGTPLELGRGKTFIAIVSTGARINFS